MRNFPLIFQLNAFYRNNIHFVLTIQSRKMFGHIFVGFLITMLVFYLLSCAATILYRACKDHSKYLEEIRMNRAIDARKDLLIKGAKDRSDGTACEVDIRQDKIILQQNNLVDNVKTTYI